MRVDCHLHTALSGDAVTSIDQLAERVEQERLDVVFITDHNVTAAAVAAAERGIGARVIVGEEIRTREGDVIGLFLTERIPYVLPLAEVTGLDPRPGRAHLPAASVRSRPLQPRRRRRGAVRGRARRRHRGLQRQDRGSGRNRQAADLAARYGLPGGAGSDAHDPEGIGAAYLEMPDFDGPAEFLAALRHAQITGEYRPHAPRYARRTQI